MFNLSKESTIPKKIATDAQAGAKTISPGRAEATEHTPAVRPGGGVAPGGGTKYNLLTNIIHLIISNNNEHNLIQKEESMILS